MLQPTLSERPAFKVLGIQERASPPEVDYHALWGRFGERFQDVSALASEPCGYGVYFATDEPGKDDVFAGMAVPPLDATPQGLVLRDVPGGTFAAFQCGMGEIGPTWGAIFSEWLPQSGYEYDNPRPAYEQFPPGCREGTAPVSICVPVKPKA